MKNSIVLFILILAGFFANNTNAQRKISDEDKTAVTRILKTVDAKLVNLRYSDSKEEYGSAKISESRMKSIKSIGGPGDKGIVIHYKDASAIYLSDGSTIYVAPAQPGRTGQNNFLSVLGKTKTAQLKAILAKYLGAPDTLDATTVKTMDNEEI